MALTELVVAAKDGALSLITGGLKYFITPTGTNAPGVIPLDGATGLPVSPATAAGQASQLTALGSPAQDATVAASNTALAAILAKQPSSPALDGTDATGVTAPTGGVGVRGWLSGIYKLLSGTLAVSWSGQSVSVSNFPSSQTVAGSVAVSNLPATQPISAASLPLPAGAAQDGTDATGVTAPAGGVGVRGWLSGSYQKLSAIAASLAGTLTVAVNNAVQLAAGTNVIGAVTQSGTWTFGATISGIYNNVLPTFSSGQTTQLQTDANGRMLIAGSFSSSTVVTYSSTPPTLTNGGTSPLQSDSSGNLMIKIAAGSIANSSFGISGTLPAFAATPTFNVGTMPSVAVTGTFWQATQPVSFSGQTVGLSGSLPAFAVTPTVNLGTLNGAAADGTDATGVTQLAGGVGIRGWLSGIYSKLSGTLAVSGTFWQATQPVSLATAPALVAGSAIVGKFGIDQTTPGTTNGVVVNNTSLPTTETYVNLATNQGGTAGAPISIGQSAVPIVAARAGRKEVTLILEAAVAVRIGGSGVTSGANGVLLQGIAGEAITISGGAAVYGYAPSGTAIVSALEVY